MAKVIVERPRNGRVRRSRPKGYRRYLRQAGEDLPARERMLGRMNGGSKYFSEHLGPLCRYLRSQVGRPWNKVHADICRHLQPDSVVHNHVLTHVWGEVAVNVTRIDGVLRHGEPPGVGRPIRPGELYVCPTSGLLKLARPSRRRSVVRRLMPHALLQYHLVGNVWHEVRLRKLPADFEHCWDAFLNRRISAMSSGELWRAYGQAAYAISARVLSRKEGRDLLKKQER
jgi:hypothetical protein